jgi:hypothetical protein
LSFILLLLSASGQSAVQLAPKITSPAGQVVWGVHHIGDFILRGESCGCGSVTFWLREKSKCQADIFFGKKFTSGAGFHCDLSRGGSESLT